MKRIIALILTLAMCLSATQVFAVKRDGNAEATGTNVTLWGSFVDKYDAMAIKDYIGSHMWHETEGVGEIPGCVYVRKAVGGHCFTLLPYLKGETYVVSFYAKSVSGTQPITVCAFGGTNGVNPAEQFGSGTLTEEWQKFEFSYTCDGTIGTTNYTQAQFQLAFRTDAYGSNKHAYIDELKILAQGKVEYDWDRHNARFERGYIVVPEETGFAEPQPEVKDIFSDTDNHWAKDTIDVLAASSLVSGMGDGTYAPENSVTRAQFLTMANNILKLGVKNYEKLYEDVDKNAWYAEDIQAAFEGGLINSAMVEGGKLLPDQPITREEAASVMTALAKKRGDAPFGNSKTFTDDAQISEWAKESVYDAAAYGLIEGYPDGSFAPKGNITRAEAATMLKRVIEINSLLAVYVDGEKGNNGNLGTPESPLATIDGARKKVQPFLSDMQNHIYVKIRGGEYVLDEQVKWGVEDSGNNGYSVIYTSWGEESPVFTSGKDYTGFKLHDADKNIYRTYVGTGISTKNVFINGVRGVRAQSDVNDDTFNAFTNGEINKTEGYIICDDKDILNFTNQDKIELFWTSHWEHARFRVGNIEETEDGRVRINMHEEGWKQPMVTKGDASGGAVMHNPWLIENVYELLDTPGEWYLNETDGYLYYMPRAFEKPETMVARIPKNFDTGAFLIDGNAPEDKAHNIKFNNIDIEFIGWDLPEELQYGYKAGQSFSVLASNNEYNGSSLGITREPDDLRYGAEPGAVIARNVAYIDFTDCKFAHLGAAGLQFKDVYQNCNVIGNEIYDTAGTGLYVGVARRGNNNKYMDTYIKPYDYEYYRIYNKFNNNLIHDVGILYTECTGLYADCGLIKSEFNNNEIYNTKWSAISYGYGLDSLQDTGTGIVDVEINNNYIHDFMANGEHWDGGGIYFYGSTGGTDDNYNSFKYNYLESGYSGPGYIYTDSGTDHYEITNNVCEYGEYRTYTYKGDMQNPVLWFHTWAVNADFNYVHDNYTDIPRAMQSAKYTKMEDNTVYETGSRPQNAQNVIDNAGLEKEYLSLAHDEIQNIKFTNLDDNEIIYLKEGETFDLEILGRTRKRGTINIPYDNLNFYSSNPGAITVDENGTIKGVGKGHGAVYVDYLDDDTVRRIQVNVICGEKITEINAPTVTNFSKWKYEKVNVILDSDTQPINIAPIAKTETGRTFKINGATYEIEDPSVISVSEKGLITPLKVGDTSVKVTAQIGNRTYEDSYPVCVNQYVENPDKTQEYIDKSTKFTKGHAFFDLNNWDTARKEKYEDGVLVQGQAYFTQKYIDDLISFDIIPKDVLRYPQIHWKSQAFNMGTCYLFGFGTELIELQKRHYGEHCTILGYGANTFGGGHGKPNEYNGDILIEQGKRYSITIGTIREENGNRCIFIINGVPVFDYVDDSPAWSFVTETGDGYLGFSGGQEFVLLPYTGITNEQEQGRKKNEKNIIGYTYFRFNSFNICSSYDSKRKL